MSDLETFSSGTKVSVCVSPLSYLGERGEEGKQFILYFNDQNYQIITKQKLTCKIILKTNNKINTVKTCDG